MNKKDLQLLNVDTPSQCATKCDNQLKIHCRSFNFCPESKACYLSETHSIDGLAEGQTDNLECTHYSSKIRNIFF